MSSLDQLIGIAKENGAIDEVTVRQGIAELYSLNEIARYTNLRAKALRSQGKEIVGQGNMAKLSMSRILVLTRQLGLHIMGPYGTLHAYDEPSRAQLVAATDKAGYETLIDSALFGVSSSIYGGSDEIQHNILGERVLGLPKEPNNDRVTPFRDLPKNG